MRNFGAQTVLAPSTAPVLAEYWRSTGAVLAPSTETVLRLLMLVYIFIINILVMKFFFKIKKKKKISQFFFQGFILNAFPFTKTKQPLYVSLNVF